ncbi:hypothetical protein TEA_002422 [Camellia sinensis var. sinensis]|uniref:Uncharacterized protein n=1 Tax=Camellia sinensis var. sinensis TaxID=542762 RepID=A0A4S4E8J6_CAMSN|nr:hypothetical protein TEA_002422 [Camellia sinensis var. sinensis]
MIVDTFYLPLLVSFRKTCVTNSARWMQEFLLTSSRSLGHFFGIAVGSSRSGLLMDEALWVFEVHHRGGQFFHIPNADIITNVEFFICLVLTILGYIPGIVYALYAMLCVDLIAHGINAADVKKLQDVGIYTCNGLMMHMKKSVAFTGAPLFVIAAICRTFAYDLVIVLATPLFYSIVVKILLFHSSYIFLVLTILIILVSQTVPSLFALSTLLGCVVLYTGQGKFHTSTSNTLDYVVWQANTIAESLGSVLDYLEAAISISEWINFFYLLMFKTTSTRLKLTLILLLHGWCNQIAFIGSSIGLVKLMQPAISNPASADSVISSKTDPNLCFATHAHSNISFSGLSVESSAADHQDWCFSNGSHGRAASIVS